MIIDELEVFRQTMIDMVELFCKERCCVYGYIKEHDVPFMDKRRLCNRCEIHDLKEWILYTKYFGTSDFVKFMKDTVVDNFIHKDENYNNNQQWKLSIRDATEEENEKADKE